MRYIMYNLTIPLGVVCYHRLANKEQVQKRLGAGVTQLLGIKGRVETSDIFVKLYEREYKATVEFGDRPRTLRENGEEQRAIAAYFSSSIKAWKDRTLGIRLREVRDHRDEVYARQARYAEERAKKQQEEEINQEQSSALLSQKRKQETSETDNDTYKLLKLESTK